MEYHDPRAELRQECLPYELGVDLASIESPKVAFLANGFPDSVPFLDLIADAIRETIPGLKTLSLNKGDASIVAPQRMLDELADADAAVAAYGH